MDILLKHERLIVTADAMRPGDEETMVLLRHFSNAGVTPEEYSTAMPKLFQYAVKEESGREVGFDGDFLVVAEWLIRDTRKRIGGWDLASLPKEERLTFLGRVYGKLELLKQTFWSDPAQAEYKQRFLEHAENMLIERDYYHGGYYSSDWGASLARDRQEERLKQRPE